MTPTADLYDEHGDDLRVLAPIFRDYGANQAFSGPVSTVKVFEDNSLARSALEEPGEGRVLVVDGGGSMRCALVGDNLALMGQQNGWAGIVVFGCIRDSADIEEIDLGVKALGCHPLKSVKRNEGQRDIPVAFAGLRVSPGNMMYADPDGIVVANEPLPE